MMPFSLSNEPASSESFSQIAASLTSILPPTTGSTSSKSIFADSINEIGGGKVIVETRYKQSGMQFFIFGAKLALNN